MRIRGVLLGWREEGMIRFWGNLERKNLKEMFEFVILVC